jgi:hypothetical protein
MAETGQRQVCWVSAGAASAVAAKLTPDAVLAYCETGAEHPDNERFLADCEGWLGRPIERLRSARYASTWDVFEKRRYLAGVEGALCTVELKVMPRLAWQMPTDIHVFGYTADGPDVARAKRLRETYFEMQIRTPLIDKGITKESCLAMIERAGIELPPMYGMGFHNNNCIPCVKATSPNYWSNVRKHFPEEFGRMGRLSRDLDVRLCRINDERHFIDEIPSDWPTTDAISPSCDFLCHIAEQEMADG